MATEWNPERRDPKGVQLLRNVSKRGPSLMDRMQPRRRRRFRSRAAASSPLGLCGSPSVSDTGCPVDPANEPMAFVGQQQNARSPESPAQAVHFCTARGRISVLRLFGRNPWGCRHLCLPIQGVLAHADVPPPLLWYHTSTCCSSHSLPGGLSNADAARGLRERPTGRTRAPDHTPCHRDVAARGPRRV